MPKTSLVPKQHFQLSEEKFCKSPGRIKYIITGSIFVAQYTTRIPETPGLSQGKFTPQQTRGACVHIPDITRLTETVSLVLSYMSQQRAIFTCHYPQYFTERILPRTDSDHQLSEPTSIITGSLRPVTLKLDFTQKAVPDVRSMPHFTFFPFC